MIFGIALAIAIAPSTNVAWCSAPGTPKEELTKATAVLSGKVVGHDFVIEQTPSGETAQRVVVNVAVTRVWKGDISPSVTIHTWKYLLPNGYTRVFSENFNFDDETEYLVYAFGKPDHLWVDQCSRTRKLSWRPMT